MLKITARLSHRLQPDLAGQFTVVNVGGGAIASYRSQEVEGANPSSPAKTLKGYSRWSEPVGGLVALAMQVMWGKKTRQAAYDLAGLHSPGDCGGRG